MAIVRWGSNPDEITDFDRLRQAVNRLFNVFAPGTSGMKMTIPLTDPELRGVDLIATIKILPSLNRGRRIWSDEA